jgi:DNA-directed RNA polymerase subunit RPC12/RpoP
MRDVQCICLSCGRMLMFALKNDADLENKTCPYCKGQRLVEYKPDGFLGRLFGSLGGG